MRASVLGVMLASTLLAAGQQDCRQFTKKETCVQKVCAVLETHEAMCVWTVSADGTEACTCSERCEKQTTESDCLSVLCEDGSSTPATAERMSVLSSIASPGNATRVRGFRFSPNGQALVADGASGVAHFDVTNQQSPVLVQSVLGSGTFTYDSFGLSTVMWACSGSVISAFLVAPPANLVASVTSSAMGTECRVMDFGHMDVPAGTGRAMVFAAHKQLRVIDWQNLASPVLEGVLGLPDYAVDILLDAAAKRVYVAMASAGLLVVDVSLPASPVQVAAAGGFGARSVTAFGTHVYIAAGSAGVVVYDTTTLSVVSTVGPSSFNNDVVISTHAHGGRLYASTQHSGLFAFSLANPVAPAFMDNLMLATVFDLGNTITQQQHAANINVHRLLAVDGAGLKVIEWNTTTRCSWNATTRLCGCADTPASCSDLPKDMCSGGCPDSTVTGAVCRWDDTTAACGCSTPSPSSCTALAKDMCSGPCPDIPADPAVCAWEGTACVCAEVAKCSMLSKAQCGGTCPENDAGKCAWDGAAGTCGCVVADKACEELAEAAECILHTCQATGKPCRWERDTTVTAAAVGVCRCPPADAPSCRQLSARECMGECPENRNSKCVWDTDNNVCGCDCSTEVRTCEDFSTPRECAASACPEDRSLNCTWSKAAGTCMCPTSVECATLSDPDVCIVHTCPTNDKTCQWELDAATGKGVCACPSVEASCKLLSKDECGGVCPDAGKTNGLCKWNDAAAECECDCSLQAVDCKDFADEVSCKGAPCPDKDDALCAWDSSLAVCTCSIPLP